VKNITFRAPLIVAGFLLATNLQLAYGQCQEDTRTVTLKKDNVARLKSAVCKADGSDVRVKVEQYRFSDAAASIIASGQILKALVNVVGKFRTAKNDVLKTYADLLSEFGETTVLKGDYYASLAIPGDKDDVASNDIAELQGGKLRTLTGAGEANLDYPAIEEIRLLRTKVIPTGLAYFYEVACRDQSEFPIIHDDKNKCFKFKPSETTMLFWRSMESTDITRYSDRAKQYNLLLKPKDRETYTITPAVPRELRLYEYISKGAWPKDFVTLAGYKMVDGCSDYTGGGALGWRFTFHTRSIFMDATSIQNLSNKPITIDHFIGASSPDSTLRPLSSSLDGALRLNIESAMLAPGERILVPTRIAFAPSVGSVDQFSYLQTAAQLFASRGSQGFTGNTAAHKAPDLKEFVYGPEISISGISTANTTINFKETTKTALNITIGADSGSCPILLFRQSSDQWISSGKILQTAKGVAGETSETIAFPGLVSQFRLEEREPEVARLRRPTLTLRLRNRETLTLTPNQPFHRDGFELLWGDAFEFSFDVPESVSGDSVMESRLEITGYYDRYSEVLASNTDVTVRPLSKPASSTCVANSDIRAFARRVLK